MIQSRLNHHHLPQGVVRAACPEIKLTDRQGRSQGLGGLAWLIQLIKAFGRHRI